MEEKSLNLDIPGSVSEFEVLIRKVLPKNIFYQIVFGKGLEFDGYRDFSMDEDASAIDWKATVRGGGKTLARKYIEERDLKIMFLIDVSDNMVFGSTEKLKCEFAAELAAALAHVILVSGDRVGFVLFNDKVVKMRMPGFGDRFFDIFSYELSNPENYGGVSDLNKVLEDLIGKLDKSTSMVFVISDFLNINEEHKKNLELLSGLYETIAIVVKDPLDKSLPAVDKEVVIENFRTHEKKLINPLIAKYSYEINSLKQTDNLKRILRNSNIDFSEYSTDSHFAINLAEFLKERSQRRVYKKNDVH